MMIAFLNGRYIYKNINPTTSKDDVIIMRYIYIYIITWLQTPYFNECLPAKKCVLYERRAPFKFRLEFFELQSFLKMSQNPCVTR